MTITKNDIKLLASERLTDDADGGGFMTATVVSDGVENNLFPDISDLDRAQGANDFRKTYASVLTATSESYYGAHVIIDSIPADPAVSGLLRAASGQGELRSEFIADAEAAATGHTDGGAGWYSTKPLRVARAPGDTSVKIDGLAVSLIPTSSAASAVSGSVVNGSNSQTTGAALVGAGPLRAPVPFLNTYAGLTFPTHVLPNSVSGTLDIGATTGILVDDVLSGQAYPLLSVGGNTSAFYQVGSQWAGDGSYTTNIVGAVTANAVTYQPAFLVSLPLEVHEFEWTVGMSLTQFVVLPYTSEPGSETISYATTSGTLVASNSGVDAFHPTVGGLGASLSATINRTSKTVSLFFDKAPQVGSKVTIRYARAGFVQSLASGAVPGAFAANQLTVTPSSGYTLRAAMFKLSNGNIYVLKDDKAIYQNQSIVGSFNPTTGKLQLPVADGVTVTEWNAVEVSNALPMTSVQNAALTVGMSPSTVTLTGTKTAGGTFTATADANGAFATPVVTGTYDKLTGLLNVTFSEPVAASSLAYSGTQLSFTPVTQAVAGVNPALFPTSGEVAAFHPGDVIVVHNTQATAPQTVTNAQVVNLGRTNLSDVRVFGQNGVEIVAGFSYSAVAGTVTFSNVAGYSQPVTITHRVENVRMALTASVDGAIALSSALSHTFPADTSFVSSALVLADLFARSHAGFQQNTWTAVWSDAPIGGVPLADFNEAAHPITVTNSGAITERWVVVFTNSNTFTVTGEQVGYVAAGNTASDCTPLNPATGVPYFTIPATGWGSGWAVGNVYRFNTTGASSPFWTIRSIKPSDPFAGQDKLTIALRGSINA